ncbi:amidohydrolase family protein [Leptolyngbya sp. FACHB-16]|uniref:amidohydrolase family protein n=1 Tax=unclassified Leptolyngbya TaxID=2650499 RepID=UPI0016828884|nr:amidohydrolase family protein [Leptolyngbya sp. FACHB-16]MBD2157861.1 amidohydrolase family protein [Leptolyngbya sp. FACHB-16]
MIIDCHCHAGKGDLLTGPWDTDAPLNSYLKRARVAGINKTVIFAPFHSNYRQANANTARLVSQYPDRLLGFAFVHARRDRGHIHTLMTEAVNRWRFCGIKVHRLDAPLTREICEAAQVFRLPLLYDPVGQTDLIDLLAPEYPTVNFIIPHLGSFADDWRTHLRVIDQLVRHPNVYADTSGVRRFDYLEQAVRRGGAHKVLFGSDGPWLHPGVELHKIRLLGLPPQQESLILGKNFLRLVARIKSAQKPRMGAQPTVLATTR